MVAYKRWHYYQDPYGSKRHLEFQSQHRWLVLDQAGLFEFTGKSYLVLVWVDKGKHLTVNNPLGVYESIAAVNVTGELWSRVGKAACKRTQQLSTLFRQQCWELLRAR